jgi:hypothetical protein
MRFPSATVRGELDIEHHEQRLEEEEVQAWEDDFESCRLNVNGSHWWGSRTCRIVGGLVTEPRWPGGGGRVPTSLPFVCNLFSTRGDLHAG